MFLIYFSEYQGGFLSPMCLSYQSVPMVYFVHGVLSMGTTVQTHSASVFVCKLVPNAAL